VGALGREVDAASRDMTQLAVTTNLAKRQIDDLGDEALGSAGQLAAFGELGNLAGKRMSKGLVESLAENIGALPSKLRGGAILAGVGLGVVMAPFLGGVISSAVLGTVGGGGVIGGAVLAARDPQVQAAWKDLGQDVLAQLTEASEGFREPLIKAAHEFGAAFRESQITDVLREAAQLVAPLTAGIAGFVRELGPGLKAAIEAAMPTFRVLASELPQLGKSISNMLRSISSAGPEAAAAMRDLFNAVETTVEAIGPLLKELSELYILTRGLAPAILENSDLMTALALGALPALTEKLTGGNLQSKGLTIEQQRLAEALKHTGGVAKTAADELDTLSKEINEGIVKAFSLEEAQDRVADAVADLTRQVKEQRAAHVKGAGSLDAHTEAGRRNRASVRGLVSDYQELIFKTAAQGQSTAGLRKKLEDQLVTMGFTRVEARKYAGALREIPKSVTTKIKLDDDQARQDLNEINRLIQHVPDGYSTIHVRTTYSGGAPLPQRWGGVVEHAQSGLLRDANIYNPGRTMYAFAEPATRGEAFIPRMGDMGRSRAIAEHVVRDWLGGSVKWGSGGGGTYVFNFPNYVGDQRALESALVRATDKLRQKGRV